jgi:hypothetical protein
MFWPFRPGIGSRRLFTKESGSLSPHSYPAQLMFLNSVFYPLLFIIAAVTCSPCHGQFDLTGDKKEEFDDFEDALAEEDSDIELIQFSHLSEVFRWPGVQPQGRLDKNKKYNWKVVQQGISPRRTLVSPLSPAPIQSNIAIPENRAYRIWLCYVAVPGKKHPVTLTLAGANQGQHIYGSIALESSAGSEIEKQHPIRFEEEAHRIAPPTTPIAVWEFFDTELKAGTTTFTLSSRHPKTKVDAIFVCASKTFSPSKSPVIDEGNLYRTYCRIRVLKSSYTVTGKNLTYHWRRIPKGRTEPLWYSSIGSRDKKGFVDKDGQAEISADQWTRWVDITEDITVGPWARGGGPWATGFLSFGKVNKGQAEVQLAWHPHESAILKTIKPGIGANRAVCMVPLDSAAAAPVAGEGKPGVWGIRQPEILGRFETAMDVHKRHFQWADEAVAGLNLKHHITPRYLNLFSPCGAAPAAREASLKMLARLGLNGFYGYQRDDLALAEELRFEPHAFIGANDSQYLCSTHDPLDPVAEKNFQASLQNIFNQRFSNTAKPPQVVLKMGDEIGSVGTSSVNSLATCRRAFYAYLKTHLKEIGKGPEYFGVEKVEELPFLPTLPDSPGLYERRVHYHSARFKFVLTAMYYAQITRAAERVFPRVYTYCNFSPHPPMFGQQMNHSDWFALTREGGANMAWGEGWASGGGWGFVGHEVVSYYAAWVECAARKRNLPAGFYIVGTMGGADKKMFSLINRGIFNLELYAYGPRYIGAEGSNFWSESSHAYAEIARGAYALGPADEIIAKGKRWPSKVAVLYNRSHEIWNGAYGGFQSDRLLTYMALTHAHIPADIILEEDLTAEKLATYKAIYVQGFNLSERHAAALKTWVSNGGVLIGVAGTAMRDEYDTPTAASEELFGAKQGFVGASEGGWHPQSLPTHKPIDTLSLKSSGLTPEMTVDVIGVQCKLTPTTGHSIGTFKDGSSAAVVQKLGKGQTLLYGIMPGHIYKGPSGGSSRYTLERRPLITMPAQKILGKSRVEYSEPQTEVCLFEHEKGIAITLSNFAYFIEPANRETKLTVQTSRKISEVSASLGGPLKWRQEGEAVHVTLHAPKTVDVVILK